MTSPTEPDLAADGHQGCQGNCGGCQGHGSDAASPAWLGAAWPRARRQTLALGYLVAIGVAAAGALVAGSTGLATTVVGVLAAVAMFVVLRGATKVVADGEEGAVHELVQQLRGQCFQMAYNVLAGVAALIGAVLLVVGTSRAQAGLCGLVLLGLAPGLPTVLLALTLPDRRA
jgi:hypothetical protein